MNKHTTKHIPDGFFDDPSAWRHHGLGVLQREITPEKRVHVWHPDLKFISGLRGVHDHRFDLRSTVVYGDVTDERWAVDVEPRFNPHNVEVWEIKHAKIQTGEDAGFLCQANARHLYSGRYVAGQSYLIRRRVFHTSIPQALAITVVERSNFAEKPARVLSPLRSGTPQSAIRKFDVDDVLVVRILALAAAALQRLEKAHE